MAEAGYIMDSKLVPVSDA